MKRAHTLTIRGNTRTWQLVTYVDPKYMPDWRKDGLNMVRGQSAPIVGVISEWIVRMVSPGKLHSVKTRGLKRRWAFTFHASPDLVSDLSNDGLDVGKLAGSVPMWVMRSRWVPLSFWWFLQDVVNFRNPFRG